MGKRQTISDLFQEKGSINEPKLLTESVSFDFDDWVKAHDGEGRTIALEMDQFYLVNCYVPNSGNELWHSFIPILIEFDFSRISSIRLQSQ